MIPSPSSAELGGCLAVVALACMVAGVAVWEALGWLWGILRPLLHAWTAA
jgi:hypothetical protein